MLVLTIGPFLTPLYHLSLLGPVLSNFFPFYLCLVSSETGSP